MVGGGAASLTAALVLARARHRVTVVDDGTYRNATVDEFHGFPTRDGTAPDRFRTDAHRELRSYGVTFVTATINTVHTTERSVTIELSDATTIEAAAMLLATGVHDDLPAIDGLASRWGKSVFNCPFCDGWEQRDKPVVVIDAAPGADHLATMLRSWTPNVAIVASDDVATLTGRGTALTHVVLRDGSTIAASAAFVKAPVIPRSALARELGCELDDDGYVLTDESGATTHPLVWAAGDVRRAPPLPHQVVLAAADGSTAAIAMHKAFVSGGLQRGDPRAVEPTRDASGNADRGDGRAGDVGGMAEEHVITGSVLVTFALAWAMLALLAERWTNQPQRWAIAPAVFMALTGTGILVFAPTGNQLGWVWPPVVVALTIWMIVHARRALRSRTRVWLVYPVFAALMLSAFGGAYETYRETTDRDNYPMPGRLIDVGGHSLHINCTGTGSPTVVLEPGLGEPSTAMAWIAPDVAATTRVCVYDRAGRGWSESASAPQDGVQTATDLHALLERAGEPGPYVLAGHSAGGIYTLNFAQLYPQQVAGVVLLDSMHPEQYTKIASWPAFYEMFRRVSALLPSLSRLGVGRVMYQTAYGELPDLARDQEQAFVSTPRHSRSVRDEFSQLRTAMAQASSLTGLGDRPLVVVTAEKEAEDGWMAAQDELAALSTNSVHRVVPDATHAMLTENEEAAVESSQAIRDIVNAVRAGTPVAG